MNINEYSICPECGDPMWLHHEQERGAHDECLKEEAYVNTP